MQKLNPDRDKELFSAFKKEFSSSRNISYQQAIRHAVNSPCSQFYVSAEEAYRFINLKLKHRDLVITSWRNGRNPISKHKLRAFRLIYQRYLELRRHKAFQNCSSMFVASFACASPAPCFFLSFRRALEIIRQMRRYGEVRHRKSYGSDSHSVTP